MSTFHGTYGSQAMMSAISMLLDSVQLDDEDMDIHTITLVLNGQHGEFDLVVEATDDDLEPHRWEGIAHRTGGVAGWQKVEVP